MTSTSPDTLFSAAAHADPDSASGLKDAIPTLKGAPSLKKRIFITALMYLFLAIQLTQGGLAISTVVFTLKQGQQALQAKSKGDYQIAEITFLGKKGYYLPEITSGLSLINGTYNLPTLASIDNSPLEFCLIFSDPALAQQALDHIHDASQIFYVQIVSTIIVIFDLLDAVKPIFFKFKAMLFRLMKIKPKKKANMLIALWNKALILGVVASPRYLVLNFTGEDYTNCVGFNDQNPFYTLDQAFFTETRPNTMNTWQNNSMTFIFSIYQIFLAFLLIFVVGIGFLFINPNKNIKWKIANWCFKFLFLVGGLALILLGMVYFIINWMLIAAQMKENAAVILSILFLSRDFINVFTVTIIGFLESAWSSLQDVIMKVADAAMSPNIGINMKMNLNTAEPKMLDLNPNDPAAMQQKLKAIGEKLNQAGDKVEGYINNLEQDAENPGRKKESLFTQAKNKASEYIKGEISDKVSGFVKDEAGKAGDNLMGTINGGKA